jgi:hypothetical protein
MASDVDKAIQENLKFTLELADKILLSAGKDPNDAFIKAIGTLAQVIYIITPDDQREQSLNDTMRSLKRIWSCWTRLPALARLPSSLRVDDTAPRGSGAQAQLLGPFREISFRCRRLADCPSGRIRAAFCTVSAKRNRAKSPYGILPHALAFGQLRDRRLKALLDILACGYLNLLTVIVSDPHTVLVDPTVLDFANAFCCHASI